MSLTVDSLATAIDDIIIAARIEGAKLTPYVKEKLNHAQYLANELTKSDEEQDHYCAEAVAAQAYQVIGALAETENVFNHPEVQRALDYFGDIANGEPDRRGAGEILPWAIPPK